MANPRERLNSIHGFEGAWGFVLEANGGRACTKTSEMQGYPHPYSCKKVPCFHEDAGRASLQIFHSAGVVCRYLIPRELRSFCCELRSVPFGGACLGLGRAKFGWSPFDSLIPIVRRTALMICNGSLCFWIWIGRAGSTEPFAGYLAVF